MHAELCSGPQVVILWARPPPMVRPMCSHEGIRVYNPTRHLSKLQNVPTWSTQPEYPQGYIKPANIFLSVLKGPSDLTTSLCLNASYMAVLHVLLLLCQSFISHGWDQGTSQLGISISPLMNALTDIKAHRRRFESKDKKYHSGAQSQVKANTRTLDMMKVHERSK
jgi:hypothetical protein